jgi:hypothetical protein
MPNFCMPHTTHVFSQNTAIHIKLIHFFDEIKLILYPSLKYFTTGTYHHSDHGTTHPNLHWGQAGSGSCGPIFQYLVACPFSPTHQPLEGSFAGFLFLLVVHHVSKEGKEICQGRNVQ